MKKHMTQNVSNLLQEKLGNRLKNVRRYLMMTQQEVAEQTDISVITISKIEHDKVVNSDSFLRLLLFYSNYISADFLFAKDFNVADADNYTKSFSLNTIVKAKIEVIREEFEKELSKLKSEYIQKLTETANLL
ncbi:MAG: XRE family transcriptional regulator [Prevotella sp.]|jgi:toxin-antitoxin system, antitoxin component, xre family|uniref:helix-turn-helix domain-containing protein n=1 Tax=Prevotella TaxID=838 RepID=UPI000F15E2F9|nr:helix-turn-helix transcriptional regulator [Prevotella bivia]MBF1645455.1 helix-turn-helix transcriptional regulator [Prevotella sp.]MDZ3818688.1 helix-turn-helix transcriptional regulator [Prevotella bivia]RKW59065.1 MAG: XRE family transcriptional regulator [Prevotella sp.]